jgi:hypothetical protein
MGDLPSCQYSFILQSTFWLDTILPLLDTVQRSRPLSSFRTQTRQDRSSRHTTADWKTDWKAKARDDAVDAAGVVWPEATADFIDFVVQRQQVFGFGLGFGFGCRDIEMRPWKRSSSCRLILCSCSFVSIPLSLISRVRLCCMALSRSAIAGSVFRIWISSGSSISSSDSSTASAKV